MQEILEKRTEGAVVPRGDVLFTGSKRPDQRSKYGSDGASLFVEAYLEKPVYEGDPMMLTLPTACTFRGVPLMDDL